MQETMTILTVSIQDNYLKYVDEHIIAEIIEEYVERLQDKQLKEQLIQSNKITTLNTQLHSKELSL